MNEEEMKVEVTSGEAALLRRLLREFDRDMRDRKNAPKGWTYGEVQDGLANSKSLQAKLA